jgi:hypothetical protein
VIEGFAAIEGRRKAPCNDAIEGFVAVLGIKDCDETLNPIIIARANHMIVRKPSIASLRGSPEPQEWTKALNPIIATQPGLRRFLGLDRKSLRGKETKPSL